jgi:hypothetical protein
MAPYRRFALPTAAFATAITITALTGTTSVSTAALPCPEAIIITVVKCLSEN